MVSGEQVRVDERAGPLWLGVAFFGACAGYVVWDMFIQGENPDQILTFLDLTPRSPAGYVILAGAASMIVLALWRLTVARGRVVLAGDRMSFGNGGRRQLHRADVARAEVDHDGVLVLHLVDPDDPQVRERARIPDGVRTVELHPVAYRDGDQLVTAVRRWAPSDAG